MDLKNGGARIWSGKYFNQEGYAINSIGGYIAEGLFKTEEEVANSATIPGTDTAPGDIKYRDIITMEKSMEKTVSTLVTPCLSGHLA